MRQKCKKCQHLSKQGYCRMTTVCHEDSLYTGVDESPIIDGEPAIYADIEAELNRANQKYQSRFNSLNEALGTIRAEYCELESEIVQHAAPERVREEAVQVAAMCVKLIQYLDREECK